MGLCSYEYKIEEGTCQMEKIEDYIIFITIGTAYGNGLIVGNHLITAGHVIHMGGNCDIFSFRFKGKDYSLNKNNYIEYIYCPPEECAADKHDVYIFDLTGIVENLDSPLTLSDENPISGDILQSISCKERSVIPDNKNLPVDRKEYNISAKVFEIEGNFFRCQMEAPLRPEQSGSTVIKGKVVMGILYGGIEHDIYHGKECLFQSAKSIIKLLHKEQL